MRDPANGGVSCAVTEDFIVIAGFVRQLPNADRALTLLEDAAISDHQQIKALLDHLLTDSGGLVVRESGDFCGPGDFILSEAVIKLASKSRRTTVSHCLTLEEAGKGAPLPFSQSPVLKIDGKRIPVGPEDTERLSRAVRTAWSTARIVSPLVAAEGV